MKLMSRLTTAVALAAVFAASTTAAAQTTHHVALSKIDTGVWTLTPIYSQESGAGATVVSFLALADMAAVSGGNIVTVWYQRDASGWTAKSWETTDPWVAIKSVKQAMGIPDAEDERWGAPGLGMSVTDAEQPKEYAAGVLVEDPLASFIVGSPDRASLVEFLTSIGYKAADVSVDEEEDGCTTNAKLDGMAAAAKSMVMEGDNTILTLSDQTSLCDVFAGLFPIGDPPIQPAPPATPPAWSPPGTVPSGPTWTPGTWPAAPNGYYCWNVLISDGGGTNCICVRRRYWGRWETTMCGWFWRSPCTMWHQIIEIERCIDINVPCPPGGPPATTNCRSRYE